MQNFYGKTWAISREKDAPCHNIFFRKNAIIIIQNKHHIHISITLKMKRKIKTILNIITSSSQTNISDFVLHIISFSDSIIHYGSRRQSAIQIIQNHNSITNFRNVCLISRSTENIITTRRSTISFQKQQRKTAKPIHRLPNCYRQKFQNEAATTEEVNHGIGSGFHNPIGSNLKPKT